MCFFEVCDEVSGDGIAMMSTQSRLEFPIDGKKQYAPIYSRNHTLKAVTAKGFKRLCQVLGVKWVKGNKEREDDTPVGVEEFASLFFLFRNEKTMTNEELEEVTLKYGIDRWFRVDHTKSREVNIDECSQLLRCIQPVINNVFDGQHRMENLGFCNIGYFNAMPKVEMELQNRRMTLEDYIASNPNMEEYNDSRVEDMQLFCHHKLKFGEATDCNTMEERFAKFRAYGGNITLGQNLVVSATLSKTVANFLDECNRGHVMGNSVEWNFSNYWTPDIKAVSENMKNNGELVTNAFADYIEGHSLEHLVSSSSCKWKKQDSRNVLIKAMKGFNSPTGYGLRLGIKKIAQPTASVMVLLKFFTDNQDGYETILRYLNGDTTPVAQQPGTERLDFHYLRSIDFFDKTINPVVVFTCNHLSGVVSCEFAITNCIRKSNGDTQIAAILNQEHDSRPLDFYSVKAVQNALRKVRDAKVTDAKLEQANIVSGFSQKLSFSIRQSLLVDVIKTFSQKGMNPQLKKNSWYSGPEREDKEEDVYVNNLVRAYML